jgi:hypothetical protein
MLLISGLIGIPFALTANRSRTVNVIIQIVAGSASLILGLALAWDLMGV